LAKYIEIIEKFISIFEEICKIKYVKNMNKDLIELKIEEIRSMNICEIYTKITIDYLKG
jgi:hypothetical protein